jgi:hypothetical protein
LFAEEFYGGFVQALWDDSESVLFDPLHKPIGVFWAAQNEVRSEDTNYAEKVGLTEKLLIVRACTPSPAKMPIDP